MSVHPSQTGFGYRFADIIYAKDGYVARVTLNRPATYHALSSRTLTELIEVFRDSAGDDRIGVIVLTGWGDEAFCSGIDAQEFAEEFLRRPRDFWKYQGLLREALDLFRQAGKPTIARINGVAAGMGNDWHLAADLAIAAEHARFLQTGTRVGLVDAWGASQWLPLVVGDRRARQMLLTGEEISADQALNWGLVNEVVPLPELDQAVTAWAERLRHKFPECIRYTKQQLDFWKDLSWQLTAGHARQWLTAHATSWETYEGVRAFVEKRPPDYAALRARATTPESNECLWGPPTQTCRNCAAQGMPELFLYCGKCGSKLK